MSRGAPDRADRPKRPARLWLGYLMIVAAAAALTITGHTLLWTNVQSSNATDEALADLRNEWDHRTGVPSRGPVFAPPAAPSPAPVKPFAPAAPASAPAAHVTPAPEVQPPVALRPFLKKPSSGAPFALMTIPKLGASWAKPVIEGSGYGPGGISSGDLKRGVVHYPGTGFPGESGNFAVAGHRTTYGQPFRHIHRLSLGDEVTIETHSERLTYSVTRSEIVKPTDTSVLWAVPIMHGTDVTQPMLTLTTCHPAWSARERLIVVAVLSKRVPVPRT